MADTKEKEAPKAKEAPKEKSVLEQVAEALKDFKRFRFTVKNTKDGLVEVVGFATREVVFSGDKKEKQEYQALRIGLSTGQKNLVGKVVQHVENIEEKMQLKELEAKQAARLNRGK